MTVYQLKNEKWYYKFVVDCKVYCGICKGVSSKPAAEQFELLKKYDKIKNNCTEE